MDLVRIDPDDWTIFLMHLTDLEDILTSLHDVVVELVPTSISR